MVALKLRKREEKCVLYDFYSQGDRNDCVCVALLLWCEHICQSYISIGLDWINGSYYHIRIPIIRLDIPLRISSMTKGCIKKAKSISMALSLHLPLSISCFLFRSLLSYLHVIKFKGAFWAQNSVKKC